MTTAKELTGKLIMEVMWWIFTAIVVWIVVQPLWNTYIKYDFIYDSIVNIVIFITFTRYIFLLKYTVIAQLQIAKFLIIFLCIPLGFYLIQEFFNFQDFLDKEGTGYFQAFFPLNIDTNKLYNIIEYTTKEISFFAVGAIIVTIILPFRLLISFWRVYNNTGTV
jgi:hypothetical protein